VTIVITMIMAMMTDGNQLVAILARETGAKTPRCG